MTDRWGITVPFIGVPLLEHRPLVEALPDLGYTDLWSSETNGLDAFTPLVLAAAWEPTLRLGTAIVPVYTRGPALIAMSASALAQAAPGRAVLGLGASSPVIVENWNAGEFTEPYRRTRDVLRAVRTAVAGDRVDGTFDTFAVSRFSLDPAPEQPPAIALAALRPQMLALAGREADGAILNWLAATDVPQCTAAIGNADTEVIARIFVCPTTDADYARFVGRQLIAAYLTVPAYAKFHEWLGRGGALAPMQAAWAAGDRKAATAAIPDAVVDELIVHGAPEACQEQIAGYAAAGVDTPVPLLLPTADGPPTVELLRRLGPSR